MWQIDQNKSKEKALVRIKISTTFPGCVLSFANNLQAVGGHGEQSPLVDLNQRIK